MRSERFAQSIRRGVRGGESDRRKNAEIEGGDQEISSAGEFILRPKTLRARNQTRNRNGLGSICILLQAFTPLGNRECELASRRDLYVVLLFRNEDTRVFPADPTVQVNSRHSVELVN